MKDVLFPYAPRYDNGPEFCFNCPACGGQHWFKTDGKTPTWTWNGDRKKPTVSPSILVRHGRDMATICHFFLRDGMIEFCGDTTGPLAGKTVPMTPDD